MVAVGGPLHCLGEVFNPAKSHPKITLSATPSLSADSSSEESHCFTPQGLVPENSFQNKIAARKFVPFALSYQPFLSVGDFVNTPGHGPPRNKDVLSLSSFSFQQTFPLLI